VNVQIRTAARKDILRQYGWYLDEAGPRVADRFLDAVEAAFETLQGMPDVGSPRQFQNPLLAGLRSWPIPGFPAIRAYYIHSGHSIRIVRVLHGKRDVHSQFEDLETDE
jgi:toxin ParE1/3/4